MIELRTMQLTILVIARYNSKQDMTEQIEAINLPTNNLEYLTFARYC